MHTHPRPSFGRALGRRRAHRSLSTVRRSSGSFTSRAFDNFTLPALSNCAPRGCRRGRGPRSDVRRPTSDIRCGDERLENSARDERGRKVPKPTSPPPSRSPCLVQSTPALSVRAPWTRTIAELLSPSVIGAPGPTRTECKERGTHQVMKTAVLVQTARPQRPRSHPAQTPQGKREERPI